MLQHAARIACLTVIAGALSVVPVQAPAYVGPEPVRLAAGGRTNQPESFIRISKGTGTSERDATLSALRTAIEEVAGAYVTSETVVAMKQVVKDNIQSLSSGSVLGYQVLRSTQQKGLFTVTVAATVAKEPVLSFLQGTSRVEVDGDSIYASAKLRKEQTDNAHIALCDLMKQMPKYLRFETPAPRIDIAGDDAEIQFQNEDHQQQKAWLRPGWENRLFAILKAIDGNGPVRVEVFDGHEFHVDNTSHLIIEGYLIQGIRVVPYFLDQKGRIRPVEPTSSLPGIQLGSYRGFLHGEPEPSERILMEKRQDDSEQPLEFYSTIHTFRVPVDALKGVKGIVFKPEVHANYFNMCN